MSEEREYDFEPNFDDPPKLIKMAEDVGLFLGRIIVCLFFGALFIAGIAYLIWREVAIFNFLLSTGA